MSRLFALESGRVVLAGRPSSRSCFDCELSELYDEAADRFVPEPKFADMGTIESTVTPVGKERLLLSGGLDSTRLLLHDFEMGQTIREDSSPLYCDQATLTSLPDGRILRLGYRNGSTQGECPTSLFDLGTGGEERVADLHAMDWQRSILLSSGKVLVIGAFTGAEPTDNAVVFDPVTSKLESWHLKYGWKRRVPTMMADGRVLLSGGIGYDGKTPILTAEVFNPLKSASPFEDVGAMRARTWPTSVLLGTGDVLVAGPMQETAADDQTLDVLERATMKFVSTKIRGGQESTNAATRLASGDALVMGETASFLFNASTRTIEYGVRLPQCVGAGMSLLGGDVIAATSSELAPETSELLRVTPGRTVMHDPYPIPGVGNFAPLRSGGFVHVAKSQWLISSPAPEAAQRPQVINAPHIIESGSAVDITGKGFGSCTAVDCKLGPGSALGPPTVAFLPLDGGGPLVSSVLNWSDTALRWRVPSSAYHGMGWLYVIVDGVPSEGFRTQLMATSPGGDCSNDAECKSPGVCMGGKCCDRPCGACESCWAKDKVSGKDDGTCGPVKAGEDPHNACDEEPAESCGLTGACNGQKACAKYDNGTTCKNDGQCINGACLFCSPDAQWAVSGDSMQDCAPFRCEHGVCAKRCSSDAACLPGYACDLEKRECGPYCSADYKTAIDGTETTNCHPYRCFSGACAKECVSNVECTEGYMCSIHQRCILYVPMPRPQQSCSVGFARSNRTSWQAIGVLSLCLWGRRRARRKTKGGATLVELSSRANDVQSCERARHEVC